MSGPVAVNVEEVTPDKREILGWQMYDWAWSAFTTTVVTALLGPYLQELADDAGGVAIFGLQLEGASFFSFTVAAAAICQVVILPLIGAAADHTDQKRKLLLALAYAASAATSALFVITSSTIILGGALFIVAAVGFAAAGVVYNSYLPEIAPPEQRDRVSAGGYALGYVGGGVYLALNFAMIALMDDTGLAVRLSLGGTGLWVAFFVWAFTQRRLKDRPASSPRPDGQGWLSLGVSGTLATARRLRRDYPVTFRYLMSYLIFNDGIQTVIAISTVFAADELGAEPETLLLLVLMIQFVATPGAIGFGRAAERFGAKRSLIVSLVAWSMLVIYAYADLDSIPKLWAMGVVLAFILGGSQSIARSLFSQMIPSDSEAEFFGFYEIASRGTTWVGPLLFGIVNEVTASQRQAIISLIVFFVVGTALLFTVDVRKGMVDAGQDPTLLTI